MLALAVVGGWCLPITLQAETSTERKIALMEQALNARGAGDYQTAKEALTELSAMAPSDTNVSRLLAEVEKQLAADPARGEVQLDPQIAFLDEEAEAIARAETDRLLRCKPANLASRSLPLNRIFMRC